MSIQGLPAVVNRNWWNMKQLGKGQDGPWLGSLGSDAVGHAIFVHELYSARAALMDLSHDIVLDGQRTLAALFAEYAPASDTQGSIPGGLRNDPNDEAVFVARRAGIAITTPIVLFDAKRHLLDDSRELSAKILRAMAQYEIAAGWVVPDDLLNNAMVLYEYHLKGK
jgi:hypothetical protein